MASQVLDFRKDAMALGALASRNIAISCHEAVLQKAGAEEPCREKK